MQHEQQEQRARHAGTYSHSRALGRPYKHYICLIRSKYNTHNAKNGSFYVV
jgi:hypothetical protein